jgi:hypothetical protein
MKIRTLSYETVLFNMKRMALFLLCESVLVGSLGARFIFLLSAISQKRVDDKYIFCCSPHFKCQDIVGTDSKPVLYHGTIQYSLLA